jgi:DNA-binding response OmpR family regulator
MHILIVEPDLSLARIYAKALQTATHTTAHARGAQDAIMAADSQHPDLVILELELAVHNGVEFLYEFRSYSEWQDIPVVILSHVVPNPDIIEPSAWAQLGVISYHYKPTTKLAQLLRIVEQVPTLGI